MLTQRATRLTTLSSTGGFTAAPIRSTPSSSSSAKSSILSMSLARSTSLTSSSVENSWAMAETCWPTLKWSLRTGLTQWPRCSPRWLSAPSSSTVPPALSRRKMVSVSFPSTSSTRRSTSSSGKRLWKQPSAKSNFADFDSPPVWPDLAKFREDLYLVRGLWSWKGRWTEQ